MTPTTEGYRYYLNTLPDLTDFLAVALSFASTMAIMLLVWQAVMMLYRRPRQRRWQMFCALVIFFGSGYTLLYALDVPTVLSVITTQGNDVPLVSSIRTAFITALLITLGRILNGATRPEITRETQ